MNRKCLIALPVAALAVGALALASTVSGGSAVAAPSVGYAAQSQTAPGLAPTTTSRDWQETQVSAVRPAPGRF